MKAAWNNNIDTVRILIEHGANVHAKDSQGELYTIILTITIYQFIDIYVYIHLHLCI